MARKLSKGTKLSFGLLSGIVIVALGIIAFAAFTTTSERAKAQDIPAGSLVYDGSGSTVDLTSEGSISKSLDDKYHLITSDSNITLGSHAVCYLGSSIRVLGGGYKLNVDGSIVSLADDTENSLAEEAFIKLSDRKYLIIAPSIYDEDKQIEAKYYLYLVLDKVGNAKMYSTNLSLKTTQPTVVASSNITFDIANEMVYIGANSYDVGKIMGGSTNEFDPGVYKTIDEEDNPEVIDIIVAGGDGGNGGDGGKGGLGGTGGRGGAGGTGDEHDLVEVAMLKSCTATSSEITCNYYFVDPYASLGVVYLELHSSDDVGELTISQLYADESDIESATLSDGSSVSDAVNNYWASESFKRVSVGAYDNQYVFSGLNPGTDYYVVMAHRTSNDEGVVSNYLDDYQKISTTQKLNKVTIDQINEDGTIKATLSLEAAEDVKTGYTIALFGTDNMIISTEIALTTAMISEASSGGYTFTFTVSTNNLANYKYITAKLLDTNREIILSTQSYNSFY